MKHKELKRYFFDKSIFGLGFGTKLFSRFSFRFSSGTISKKALSFPSPNSFCFLTLVRQRFHCRFLTISCSSCWFSTSFDTFLPTSHVSGFYKRIVVKEQAAHIMPLCRVKHQSHFGNMELNIALFAANGRQNRTSHVLTTIFGKIQIFVI